MKTHGTYQEFTDEYQCLVETLHKIAKKSNQQSQQFLEEFLTWKGNDLLKRSSKICFQIMMNQRDGYYGSTTFSKLRDEYMNDIFIILPHLMAKIKEIVYCK